MFSPDTAASQETPLIQRLVVYFQDLESDSSLSTSTPDMGSVTPSVQPAIVIDMSESQYPAAEDAPAPRRSGRARKVAPYAYIEESSSDPLEGKTNTKSRCKAKKTAVAARAMASKPTPKVSPKLPRKKGLGKTSKAASKKPADSITNPENYIDSIPERELGNAAVEGIEEHRSRHDAALALLMLSQSSVAEEQLAFGGMISNRDTVGDLTPSAANDYKFQAAATSELTTKQLDALLKVPARPKKFPLDLASGHSMNLSYYQIGSMPKAGLAEKLVLEAEARHAFKVKSWDKGGDEVS
ncbi:hypothetical protein HBI82_180750 [Parastagonospora nodorum]|nr:hypothetical protein HBH42_166290 [Parastagonospora nodorum]KAH4807335.1 hypothetical protein HBH61_131730 [Parastagonospora nodorum]KAH4961945.1 hypothetical protein HBI78_137020 [Parastagonospora nodorum]KAH5994478.1 hypothetical protein HBI82_180750 [Parastagonospora nodorum]